MDREWSKWQQICNSKGSCSSREGSGSRDNRAAEEFQRVTKAEMMGNRGNRDSEGYEKLKMRNCGSLLLKDF
jgi:hypothetical protein